MGRREEARWWLATAEELPRRLPHAARRLDLHYVQSRYPNGLGGDPTVYYDEEIGAECLGLAEEFVDFGRTRLDEID